jgi:beta-RFAP synthase
VGTQVGLATARALAEAWGLALDAPGLARRVGRGLRSALGVHGFAQGGFLVESGKRGEEQGLGPLAVRTPFPPEWRVVLATPPGEQGLHGRAEREAIAQSAGRSDAAARTDALCRLVLLGMLPALAEADLEAFGESLFEFNRRVGEAFAPVQGGVYAGPAVTACVEFLRANGVQGAGQSSWGPTVFGVVGDEERAIHLRARLADRFGLAPGDAWTTAACNCGARLVC